MTGVEIISLAVTVAGTVASIIAAVNASRAKEAAEQARVQVGARRTQSDMASYRFKVQSAIDVMAKYGAGASTDSMRGATPEEDSVIVRTVLLERTDYDIADYDISKIEANLGQFIDAEEPTEMRRFGKNVLDDLVRLKKFLTDGVRSAEHAPGEG